MEQCKESSRGQQKQEEETLDLNMLPLRTAVKQLEKESMKVFRENLASFFKKADKDDSGQLTINELKGALRQQGYKGADKTIDCFFKSADTSGDREVSFEEYMDVMMTAPFATHSKARLRKVFCLFDRDCNGHIDKAELQHVFKQLGRHVPDEEIQEMITLADKSNTGTINYEEFIASVVGECEDD